MKKEVVAMIIYKVINIINGKIYIGNKRIN